MNLNPTVTMSSKMFTQKLPSLKVTPLPQNCSSITKLCKCRKSMLHNTWSSSHCYFLALTLIVLLLLSNLIRIFPEGQMGRTKNTEKGKDATWLRKNQCGWFGCERCSLVEEKNSMMHGWETSNMVEKVTSCNLVETQGRVRCNYNYTFFPTLLHSSAPGNT